MLFISYVAPGESENYPTKKLIGFYILYLIFRKKTTELFVLVSFNSSVERAFVFFIGDCAAFVVELLAFCERDFHLHQSLFEIDFRRHDRIAFLFHSASELTYFGAV